MAFDTGPANGPIDEWVEGHGAGAYDKDGALAGAGRVHEELLIQLRSHPYFDEPPPKSLDRYDFNASLVRGLSLEDGAATLTALCAWSAAISDMWVKYLPDKIIACGGGRRNPTLMMFGGALLFLLKRLDGAATASKQKLLRFSLHAHCAVCRSRSPAQLGWTRRWREVLSWRRLKAKTLGQ